jgi:hypothetical protein
MTTIYKMDYAELVAAVDLYERINNTQSKKEYYQRTKAMPDYWKISNAIDTIAKEDADYWMG